jgi:hypothetical protein
LGLFIFLENEALVDFCAANGPKIPIIGAPWVVCKVKNRLAGDFWDFMREAQQSARRIT